MTDDFRTRDKIALGVALLGAIRILDSKVTLGFVLSSTALNIAIVYGVARVVDFFKKRSTR